MLVGVTLLLLVRTKYILNRQIPWRTGIRSTDDQNQKHLFLVSFFSQFNLQIFHLYLSYSQFQISNLLVWGRGIRDIIKKHNLAKLLSTRVLIDSQDMMDGYDWNLKDVEESYFASWSREEMAMIRSDISELHEELEEAA